VLANDAEVYQAVAKYILADASFRQEYEAHRHKMDLEQSRRVLRAAIATSRNIDEISKLHAELALAESTAAEDACAATCALMREKQEPVRHAAGSVVVIALRVLDEKEDEIKADEQALFEKWGVSYRPTILSKSIAAIRQHLQDSLTALNTPLPWYMTNHSGRMIPPNPDRFTHAVEWLKA
jgi:hypothetical protein